MHPRQHPSAQVGDGLAHRAEGIRPRLCGELDAPFSGYGVTLIAQWADGRLDLSADGLWWQAPDALMAIHDHFYSTPPKSVTDLRWRLQVLAEIGVGRLVRRELSQEDAAAAEMARLMA
jgi:hypothetical protein